MLPCQLSKDKIKRLKRWDDWIQDANNKMTFLSISTDRQKFGFLRSCAGLELTEKWDKGPFTYYVNTFGEEGEGRRMMTLGILSIGNNSNIDDEGRGGVKKALFLLT